MSEPPTIAKSRSETIQELGQRISRIERSRQQPRDEQERVSTGITALDTLLPAGGLQYGTLTEWLTEDEGCGATTLALMAVAEAARTGGAFVVVDNNGEFHPIAATKMGIEPADIIIIRPNNKNDAIWSLEQSLRCQGVAAAMGWVGRLDSRTFRRLQLAAETGSGIGFLMRPANTRNESTWADIRLLIRPNSIPVGCVEIANHNGVSAQADQSPQDTSHDNLSVTGDRRRTNDTACLTAPDTSLVQPNSVSCPLGERTRVKGKTHFSESSGRRLRIELLYCRDGADGGVIELEVCHETGVVRVAPQLARPTHHESAARA